MIHNSLLVALGAFFGYIALALCTDIRVDKLRPFIAEQATRIAVNEAITQYEKRQTEDEPLRVKKRDARDKLVREYAARLTKIMEGEDESKTVRGVPGE